MLNSPIPDLVILLSFTYFIGSLIISSINEAIAGAFRLRPRTLKEALEGLSFSPDWPAFVRDTLVKSPHLEALMEKPGQYPSYIAAENFLLAIVQQLGAAKYNPAGLAAAINSSNFPAGFKQVLSDIAAKCQFNIEQFEKELKTFYNNAMDRAGGWYKRKIRLILLVIAILMAFLTNLDTFRLASVALKDKDKLTGTVDNIVSHLNNISVSDSVTVVKDSKGNILMQQYQHDTTGTTARTAAANVHKLVVQYQQETGYTLGYTGWEDFDQQWGGNNGQNFFIKLLGILITAFALQLGSNFWFGLLTKTTDLRASGKKPSESSTK